MQYSRNLTQELLSRILALNLVFKTGDIPFLGLMSQWGGLWPAISFRWRTEQDEADHDKLLNHVESPSQELPIKDAAYFSEQGRQLYREFQRFTSTWEDGKSVRCGIALTRCSACGVSLRQPLASAGIRPHLSLRVFVKCCIAIN